MTAPTRDADERLQRARAIDWRFTLPDPAPGRVVLSSGVPDETGAALADAGWQAVTDDADLAVVVNPTSLSLAAALAAIRPGGAIHVSWLGSPRRWRSAGQSSPRAAADRLRRAGFEHLRWYALVPGSSGTEAIVPLDDPAALDLLLRRRRPPWRSRPARLAAETLRRTGLLIRVAPSIALTGTTGASGRDAATTYLASLPSAERHSVIQAPAPAPLLLTPRFRASRHVVALVPSSDAPGTAVTVVKMSRLADDGDVTRREAAALARIADGPAELRDTAPRLIDVGAPWGLPTLVETAVVGRPLDPTTVRREPDGAIAAVSGWLERLACLSGASAPAASRLDRLLERPMSTFAATVANPDADDVMISSTRAAIERLRSAVLPVAFEHGDASHPNLFRRDDGSVAAVDWECAEPDGLPAHDLTTLLAYVAVTRSGAATPADQSRAIASALCDAGGWAPAATRDHLARIGVDPDLARALTLVALARLTIGLVQRLGAGPADTPSAETIAFVRSHRYHLAWRSVAADGGSPR